MIELIHKELFWTLADQALPDALFVHEEDGQFLAVNRRACESLGYTREELLGLGVADIETEYTTERASQVWRSMVPGQPVLLQGRQRRKDGSTFPVEVSIGVLVNAGRRIYVGVVRDASSHEQELQAAQSAGEQLLEVQRMRLRDSASRLQGVLESMSEGLLLVDHQECIVAANPAAAVTLGVAAGALIGASCEQAFGLPEGTAAVLLPVRQVIESGEAVHQHRLYRIREGETAQWLTLNAVPMNHSSDEAARGVLLTFSDISRQVLVEEERQQSEQRFAAVVRNSTLGIGVSRLSDGAFVEINDAMLEIFGYRREEVIGRSSLDLGMWPVPEERAGLQEKMRREGAVKGFEVHFRRRNGEVGLLTVNTCLVSIDGQEHMIGMIQEIPGRRPTALPGQGPGYPERDPLTGIGSRRILHAELDRVLRTCREHGGFAGLLLIDLDHFRRVNTEIGRAQADRLLIEVAARLQGVVAPAHTVARLGGDQFAVLVQALDPGEGDAVGQLRALGDHLRSVISMPVQWGASSAEPVEAEIGPGRLTASIGVTLLTGREADSEVALRHADFAMFRAKREGRDCLRFFVGWRLQPG